MKAVSASLSLFLLVASSAIVARAGEAPMTKVEAQRKLTRSILTEGGDPNEVRAKTCMFGNLVEMAYSRDGVTSMFESLLTKKIETLLSSREAMQIVVVNCASRTVPLMDLDQLRVDAESLDGKRVMVRGQGQYVMGSFFMKKDVGDMSPILIDMAKVSREQRLDVIQRCGDVRRSCDVNVSGVVGKVAFQLGVVADVVLVK